MFSKKNLRSFFTFFLIGAVAGVFGSNIFDSRAPNQNSGVSLLRGSVERVTEGQSRYTNNRYGFSLVYPSELVIQEFEESENTMSVIFQKPGEEVGFQIFVTSYSEPTITEARIKTDIPSGIIENPVEVLIGVSRDIRALRFNSEVPLIGESTEVWFLRDGYLYEVTTYAALDEWLAEILATLTFL